MDRVVAFVRTLDQLQDAPLPLLQPRAEGEEAVEHLQDGGLPLGDDAPQPVRRPHDLAALGARRQPEVVRGGQLQEGDVVAAGQADVSALHGITRIVIIP